MEEEFKNTSNAAGGGVRESAPITKESITPAIYGLVEELEKYEIELKNYVYEFTTRRPSLEEIAVIKSMITSIESGIFMKGKRIQEEVKDLFSDKEFLTNVWIKYTNAKSDIQEQIDEVKKWFPPAV